MVPPLKRHFWEFMEALVPMRGVEGVAGILWLVAVIRTVHSTRDRPAWLSSHIPLDTDVCENPVHNDQGLASNTILHINTKDFFCSFNIQWIFQECKIGWRRHILMVQNWGKEELYWELFTILESHTVNDNATYSISVGLKTRMNLCNYTYHIHGDSARRYRRLTNCSLGLPM